MRRTDIDGEGSTDANRDGSLSGSGRRLNAVIQFPCRPSTAASGGLVAGGDPSPPPAPFDRLGGNVQAVVLRLKDNRVRIKVLAPAGDEEDRGQR